MSSHSVRTSLNGAPFDGRCDYCYTMSPLLISIVVSFKCVRMNCIPIWVVECVRVQTNDRVLKVAICNDCCCFLQFFFFKCLCSPWRYIITNSWNEFQFRFISSLLLLCFTSLARLKRNVHVQVIYFKTIDSFYMMGAFQSHEEPHLILKQPPEPIHDRRVVLMNNYETNKIGKRFLHLLNLWN